MPEFIRLRVASLALALLVRDAQQDREQREVRDERRPAVRDERQRDAGERDQRGSPRR